jgi:stage II sporulation protein D
MLIRVGLTNSSLTDLKHSSLKILCDTACSLLGQPGASTIKMTHQTVMGSLPASTSLEVSAKAGNLIVSGVSLKNFSGNSLKEGAISTLEIRGPGQFTLESLARQHGKGSAAPKYVGTLQIFAVANAVRVNLVCTLEDYVKGVLQSEVPESYHLEAIKAQAVAARTYGLHPRIDHSGDQCDVCDSYLCCQYFAGSNLRLAGHYVKAISDTKNEILTWQGKPILALFSSCAGGHTEDYSNCFSDLGTDKFPGTPIPYLKGVAEGPLPGLEDNRVTEASLRQIWHATDLATCDVWSSQFRWHVTVPADALEAEMHHIVETMMGDPQYAPFIVAPSSAKFGQIKEFKVRQRGVSGVAMSLDITTSTGVWKVNKELVIRSLFKNSELKLARLKSARFFLEHEKDRLGLLSKVSIYGLGWGHGVGMQQTGAQGLAKAGQTYKQILAHYFLAAEVANA